MSSRARKFTATTAIVAAAGAVGLIGASSASAATKTTTYPTVCGAMICTFPLATLWPESVAYEGVTCTLPGITCPTANVARDCKGRQIRARVSFTGVASVAATRFTPCSARNPEPCQGGR